MTDQGKVHAVWAIVVIILLAIIGFLVFKTTNDFKDENFEQNPNTLMENEQKPATMETTESTAAEEASAWKLYQNSKLGFEIKYPSDGRIDDTSSNSGVRIENLDPNIPDNYQMQAGDYYIELGVQTGTVDCKSMFANYKVVTVEGVSGYRGQPNPGPGEGYKDLLCFNKAGKNYIASTTFGVKDEARVTIILDSFKLITSTEASWKTYTNRMAFPFSIKYPADFMLSGNCMKDPSICSGASLTDPSNNQAVFMVDYDGAFMAPETLKTVAEREQKINNIYGDASAVKAVSYGKNKGYSFTVKRAFLFDDKGGGISLDSATAVYFTTKGRVTRIVYSNGNPLYEDIVKTFSFIE